MQRTLEVRCTWLTRWADAPKECHRPKLGSWLNPSHYLRSPPQLQEDLLRRQGQIIEADTQRVDKGVGDGGGSRDHHVLAHPPRAPRAILQRRLHVQNQLTLQPNRTLRAGPEELSQGYVRIVAGNKNGIRSSSTLAGEGLNGDTHGIFSAP